jgi:predicted acyltransferase
MASENISPSRLSSLDHFRGYAVAGMIVVNFLGGYACTPRILKHTNDYCSYADTIMPNFLFAVGFAIAMVWERMRGKDAADRRGVWLRFARRCAMLMLVAFVVYFPFDTPELSNRIQDLDFWFRIWKRDWFQTLNHIAWTTLWLLPVLPFRWPIRWIWLAGSLALHIYLSHWFYFHWMHTEPGGIDGGPLGFLTWSTASMLGLWAGDHYLRASRSAANGTLWKSLASPWMAVAIAFMLVGYASSCMTRRFDRMVVAGAKLEKLATSPVFGRERSSPLETPKPGEVANATQSTPSLGWRHYFAEPPFVPPPPPAERAWNYWMMSQKAGSISYQLFAAGLSLAMFFGFLVWIDVRGHAIPWFRTLGRNAITCYVLHGYAIDLVRLKIPGDAQPFWVAIGLLVVIATVYLIAWILESKKIFIRL